VTESNVQSVISNFFLTTITGQAAALGTYLANSLSRTASISVYDVTTELGGTPAGVPIYIPTFTLPAASSNQDLPAAAAVCCGYRAAYGTDMKAGAVTELPSPKRAIKDGAPATHMGTTRPQARDRGRFYFGPLNSSASAAFISESPRPDGDQVAPALRSDLFLQLGQLGEQQDIGGTNPMNWVVWSRRAASVKEIAFTYVDEGFATVRRRQTTALARAHSWAGISTVAP